MTETSKPGDTSGIGPDADPDTDPKAASEREARGSVQEAIGMLMGDDAARARGRAEKRAATADVAAAETPPRS